MLLCFDRLEGGVASGRLWSSCCEEVPFHGLDGLLLTMEAMMDEAGDQLSDPRHFEQGKLCTAVVYVYTRRYASIQGKVLSLIHIFRWHCKLRHRRSPLPFRPALTKGERVWLKKRNGMWLTPIRVMKTP